VHKVRHKQECKNYALKKIATRYLRHSREEAILKNIKSNFIVEVKDTYKKSRADGAGEGAILMKLYEFDLQRVIDGRP
jgi:hypothetical protein